MPETTPSGTFVPHPGPYAGSQPGRPGLRSWQERAHSLIPGGAHTYAKGDDQYPDPPPGPIVRGSGCRVWDIDGNEFIEYGMGMRAVTLGHAFPPIVAAAHEQMLLGSNFTRPAVIEVDCAELLLELVPRAEMVKFSKDGSSATTGAVKLARAHTGRDLVAVCAEHPFFSYDDWFIATTSMHAGIPSAIRDLSVTFAYNDLASVEALFELWPEQIACVILEPSRTVEPRDGFLHRLRKLCDREGAALILDETITGFRYDLRGAQEVYDVTPDLSIFGKAMANGFSVSALVGRRELMELGGLQTTKERVFLLSATHGAETHALAAAIATMRYYQEVDVIGALYAQGERLRAGIERVAADLDLSDHFRIVGRAPNLAYATLDEAGRPSQALRTLFLQEMIERGFIVPSLVVSLAHAEHEIALTIEAAGEALEIYARALEDGIDAHLRSRPIKPAIRPFN